MLNNTMHPLMWNQLLSVMSGVVLAFGSVGCFAFDSLRDQEIKQCLSGEVVTWGDNQDMPAVSSKLVFSYSHVGSPDWFSESQVVDALTRSANAWSVCGISASVERNSQVVTPPKEVIQVRWSEEGSQHNFGLANLSNRTLNLGPAAFTLLRTRNPVHDARQTLQMVISHEMGHLFGVMAHSRRCVDVTSYYDNGKGQQCSIRDGSMRPPGIEYRSTLLTACDIERCKAANGFTTVPSAGTVLR